MKFLVLFLTVCVLGSAVAHPWLVSSLTSAVSDTTNAVRQTAVGVSKATTNAAVGAAKSTTNTAVNAAKATTNVAMNAAATAKNVTINTAAAGANVLKDFSMGAINNGIQLLISQVKSIIKKTGKNVISIPDIYQKAGPISFNATKGYFKDVTTLVQDGKANVTTNGTSIKITVPFKLGEIDMGYEQFNVTMLMMKMGGGIKVHIKNDTFVVHLRLTPGLTCALNVEKVDVVILTGYEIDFTNIGKKSEWVLEKASSLIINAVKGQIKSKVQAAIDSALKSALKEDATVCSKFIS